MVHEEGSGFMGLRASGAHIIIAYCWLKPVVEHAAVLRISAHSGCYMRVSIRGGTSRQSFLQSTLDPIYTRAHAHTLTPTYFALLRVRNLAHLHLPT